MEAEEPDISEGVRNVGGGDNACIMPLELVVAAGEAASRCSAIASTRCRGVGNDEAGGVLAVTLLVKFLLDRFANFDGCLGFECSAVVDIVLLFCCFSCCLCLALDVAASCVLTPRKCDRKDVDMIVGETGDSDLTPAC